MKNIIDICKDFGFEIPAEKHADFLKAVNGEYKTIAEHNKVADKLKAAEQRAETAEETLKGFEGKDFEAITKERDEWKRKHEEAQREYKEAEEKREFSELIAKAITEAKGKNATAISALLPMDDLRSSKNRDTDIKAALEKLRTESGYLFEDNGGAAYFDKPNGNGGGMGGRKKLSDLSLDERIKLKNTNPKLYESMKKGD